MKLYNILMFIIPFTMLIVSFAFMFKLGYRVGHAEGLYTREKELHRNKQNPFKRVVKKPEKESEEERLFNISLQNIENYDGSEKGQKEVK